MNNSRREFFKQVLGTLSVAAAAPALLKAIMPSFAHAAGPTFVKPSQGMAASVNYTEDKSKVKKELQTDRGGVKFKDQKCSGCMLYTKDAGGDYGKCALFPQDMVKGPAWCSSWSKKA